VAEGTVYSVTSKEKLMTTSQTTKAPPASLTGDAMQAARYYLGNRRALLIVALLAIAGGAALNWSWLVAAGIAPVLLTALPCLVMCGLGLCMHKMSGGSCTSLPAQVQNAEPTAQPFSSTQPPAPAVGLLAGVSSCCGTVAGAKPAAEPQKSQILDERRIPHA